MHMADALISPAVGGVFWAATAGLMTYCSKKMRNSFESLQVPLMGVLGAFIFASQMINFTIPGTGSSGHLGGGLLLAILLGPCPAFMTIASVLTVQALFFADGGLLALGCNIFNLGFFPCFLAYPFIYKLIAGEKPTQSRIVAGSILAAVVGLQLGAFGVVLETLFSGISELPFSTFVLLMQPIHLAIGVVEGLVTASVVAFVWAARPEILEMAAGHAPAKSFSIQKVLATLMILALVTGTGLSWFASAHPDGLEWSMAKTSGKEELEAPEQGIHSMLGHLQEATSFLPDYGFKSAEVTEAAEGEAQHETAVVEEAEAWPAVDIGTSVAGVVGGSLTLLMAWSIALFLRREQKTS
ncbi:MAG: energy-coupling factor ABC transporter permease [Proteobacteria bacterium]|nr:energy-coupling factor ABC transporter permease [Pseudomonadota bacterium]